MKNIAYFLFIVILILSVFIAEKDPYHNTLAQETTMEQGT